MFAISSFHVSIQTYSHKAPYSCSCAASVLGLFNHPNWYCYKPQKLRKSTRDFFKSKATQVMLAILPPSLAFPSFAAAHHRALRRRKSCPCTICLRGELGCTWSLTWGWSLIYIMYIQFLDVNMKLNNQYIYIYIHMCYIYIYITMLMFTMVQVFWPPISMINGSAQLSWVGWRSSPAQSAGLK